MNDAPTLNGIDENDPKAAEQILPLVYEELRRLAVQKLRRENAGHTLQATALVHEAYLRLLGGGECQWKNRRHFFGAAAEAMRRILVESARRKQAEKHGGAHQRCDFDATEVALPEPNVDVLALDGALDRLARQDAFKAKLVELRYFIGLSMEEAAEVLDVSPRTLHREWRFTRAWLRRELTHEHS